MVDSVISISREFGSGGRIIGKKLAERLNIPCYDRTLIQKTAEKSGLSPEFIAQAEANSRSRFHFSFGSIGSVGSLMAATDSSVNNQAFFAQSEVIRDLAQEGPCVIVGRCSDYILGDDPRCVKVFIHANMADRVRRCQEDYDLHEKHLEQFIAQTDRGRANYYNYYTGRTWGDMRGYDLTLNSSLCGVDGAVELIAALVQLRAAQS